MRSNGPFSVRAAAAPARPFAILLLFAAASCGVEQAQTTDERPAELPRTAPAAVAEPAATDTTRATSFTCDDMFRFTLIPDGESATLFLPDSTLALERTPAPTGTRYTRAGIELWHDDTTATLDLPGQTHTGCAARPGADPFTAARLRGATFRAVGQEPGWYLEISPDDLTFVGDYGELTVRTAAPARTGTSDHIEWRASDGARQVLVTAVQQPCADGMSGEAFRWTATVTVAGTAYQGCGRRLD